MWSCHLYASAVILSTTVVVFAIPLFHKSSGKSEEQKKKNEKKSINAPHDKRPTLTEPFTLSVLLSLSLSLSLHLSPPSKRFRQTCLIIRGDIIKIHLERHRIVIKILTIEYLTHFIYYVCVSFCLVLAELHRYKAYESYDAHFFVVQRATSTHADFFNLLLFYDRCVRTLTAVEIVICMLVRIHFFFCVCISSGSLQWRRAR